MRKIYSLLLGAMIAMPSFAQEEDVTHLITNPGFDEDLTFTVDGSTKEITEKGSLSSRSHKWVAADGTIYAGTKTSAEGNGSWKRSDCSWLCVNGFLGQIKGWELETGSNGEWTYFGALPYSLTPGSTTIGVADDNNGSWLTVAGKPEEADTDDNLAAMYLRAGWTNYAIYSQTVDLPCAVYRLEYWINNMNFANTDASQLENLCKITCRKDVFPDEEGVNADGWQKHTIEFTPTAEFTIHMGFRAGGYGSGKNPILLLDGLKLYKIGEADEELLVQQDLYDAADDIRTAAADQFGDYTAIADYLNDLADSYDETASDYDSKEVVIAATKEAQALIAKFPEYLEAIEAFNNRLEYANSLLEAEELYPGEEAFVDALDVFTEYSGEGFPADEDEKSPFDYIAEQAKNLEQAINDYLFSQEATPESPANYSFLIDNPTFVAQGEWYIGQEGGDQRLHTGLTDNEGNSMTAWNAWRNNLEIGSSVSINQDLTDIPNGKYTVTADLCTQDGCITDQHVFATSTLQSAESPVMTITGWDPYSWETLTTSVVIVTDGKLTIGVIGNGDGDTPNNYGGTDTDKRRGWFCTSNFKLNYLGEATAEEIAEANAAKFADAEALAESMHLAADKEAFMSAIQDAKASADLEALNEAIATAEASEAEYNGIMAGSYANLQDSIANNPNYSADAKALAQVPVDYMTNYLNSAAATSKDTPAITAVLRYYRDTLIPSLQKAEAAATTAGEKGKALIESNIAKVKEDLSTYKTDDSKDLSTANESLNKAVAEATKADTEIKDGADMTIYIQNPTIDSEASWTYNRPKGDKNSTTSQGVDGVATNRYLDCWQGDAGTTRFSAYQVLEVPNGKYTLSNIMRTSGAGAYLFASTKEPIVTEEAITLDPSATTVFSEAVAKPTNNAKYGIVAAEDAVEPLPEESVYTDSYGEIYCAAADRVMAAMGISAAPGLSVMDAAIDANGGDSECPASVEPADWAIICANGGKGRGWFNNSLEIEVTDHVLVIGISCDYVFENKTEDEKFQGTWFSADNFALTLNEAGDNTGWDITSAIDEIENASSAVADGIFTLSGAKVNALKKGINIVKMNGQVKKVFIK